MDRTLLLLVVIAAILASDALLVLLGYSLRRRTGRAGTPEEPSEAEEHANSVALRESLRGINSRLAQLEQRLEEVEAQQDQLASRDQGGHAYGVAMKLVQSGTDISEIMSVCGLARGEAELIMRLHDMNRAPEANSAAPIQPVKCAKQQARSP